ncbi:MAG: leader peptide processing enzyme [Bacteroidetes bacterium]|nr:leader peptide processing enzyme [Bacteroidota bacterium]
MNKKVNTALFMLGATLVNIVLMLVLLIGLIMLIGAIFPEPSSSLAQILLIAAFLLALAGSFGIYTLIIKLVSKRIDMDKYFHPLFKPKNRGGGGRMLR